MLAIVVTVNESSFQDGAEKLVEVPGLSEFRHSRQSQGAKDWRWTESPQPPPDCMFAGCFGYGRETQDVLSVGATASGGQYLSERGALAATG
jgi:hypothetical protein